MSELASQADALGPIADRAARDGAGTALTDAGGTTTWCELADALRAAADLMASVAGVGERWAVIGDNAGPTLVAHAAGLLAGVATAALSRQLTVAELIDQLRDCGAVAAITGPVGREATIEAARRVGLRLVVVHGAPGPDDLGPDVVTWHAWLASAAGAAVESAAGAAVEPAAGAAISLEAADRRPAAPPLVYTSGTTGKARGTAVRWVSGADWTIPERRSAAEYLRALRAQSHLPRGPHLVVGPLQHNGPLTAVRQLLVGEAVIVAPKFDPLAALTAIDAHRVATTVMVPTHFTRLLALPEAERARFDVTSMRALLHTGAACPPAVKRAMIEWFGPVLIESYGGSESGTLCRISAIEWLAHQGSVGRPVPPYEVLVLDDARRPVEAGVAGLLCFRGPAEGVVRYHGDPGRSAEAYVSPGVFTLGDVGFVDGEGYVHVSDRVADMVLSGGVNLYPGESERVLAEHPAVAEVAVIGVPHSDLGEQLLALVVPADAAAPPSPQELLAWCRRELAGYKIPRRYELIDALPRNEMQKVDKRALRRPYWATERTIAG